MNSVNEKRLSQCLELDKRILLSENALFLLISDKHRLLDEMSIFSDLSGLEEDIEISRVRVSILTHQLDEAKELLGDMVDRKRSLQHGYDDYRRLIEFCNTPVWAYRQWNSLLPF